MIRLEGTAHDSIINGEMDTDAFGKVRVYGDLDNRDDAEKNYLEISEKQLAQNVIALYDHGGKDAVQRFLDNYQTDMVNVVSAVMGDNAEDSASIGQEIIANLMKISKQCTPEDAKGSAFTDEKANEMSDERILKEHQHFSNMKAIEDEADTLKAIGEKNKLLTIANNADQMSTNELGKALRDAGMLGSTDRLNY